MTIDIENPQDRFIYTALEVSVRVGAAWKMYLAISPDANYAQWRQRWDEIQAERAEEYAT